MIIERRLLDRSRIRGGRTSPHGAPPQRLQILAGISDTAIDARGAVDRGRHGKKAGVAARERDASSAPAVTGCAWYANTPGSYWDVLSVIRQTCRKFQGAAPESLVCRAEIAAASENRRNSR